MMTVRKRGSRTLWLGLAACGLMLSQQAGVRYLRHAEVREVIAAFSAIGLAGSELKDAAAWDQWIRESDSKVRARIDRGVEDSIGNLILYGTSYTRLPRLASADSAATANGELTDAARARVRALTLALARPQTNERLQFARDFLRRKSIAGTAVEGFLSANLTRFLAEQLGFQQKLNQAEKSGDPGRVIFIRSTLFEKRGLSVDTSLLPNYAIEDTLRALMQKSALSPRQVRRIAVIGPGLDFTDKRDGYDFYPLQTIQPFATLETVLRLRLSPEDNPPRLVAFDLNPAVESHLLRFVEKARAGVPYVIQLPREASAGWNAAAVSYWEHFGEIIGSPAPPLPIPSVLQGVVTRAVAINARFAARVGAMDLNIVAQTLETAPGSGFDLVVATNVLVYYDRFQQAVAMASIAGMMNVGGMFISNYALPAQHPKALEYLGRRTVSYSAGGSYGDDVVVYRRR